jgi:hypothetical protein
MGNGELRKTRNESIRVEWVLTVVHNIQGHWVHGLYPSFGILNNYET